MNIAIAIAIANDEKIYMLFSILNEKQNRNTKKTNNSKNY